MSAKEVPVGRIERALEKMERDFAEHADPLKGLEAAAYALAHFQRVPPTIAEWLGSAIERYLENETSIEETLGLRTAGKANPLRRKREEEELSASLNRMFAFQVNGLTVDEAAAMVSHYVDCKHRFLTLRDRYMRSGLGKIARSHRKHGSPKLGNAILEILFEDFPARGPNAILVAKAHAKLKKLHANP